MGFRDVKKAKVLIDFNNLVWRSHYATEYQKLKNDEGINTGCIIGLVKILHQSLGKVKASMCIPELVVCEDRYPRRKQELYAKNQSAFKEHNTTQGPIKYKGDRDKKTLSYNPIDICRKYIDCVPHTKIYMEGEEADDVMASYIHANKDERIFLYSTDRDLWQLIPDYPNLTIILPDGTSPDEDTLAKRFDGLRDFNKLLLHKIIRGDSGDTVKGVHRFPFKKTIDCFFSCKPTAEDYVRCIREKFGKDSKEYCQLMDNAELIRLNYHLVKLRKDLSFTTEEYSEVKWEIWKKLCFSFQTPSLLKSQLIRLF